MHGHLRRRARSIGIGLVSIVVLLAVAAPAVTAKPARSTAGKPLKIAVFGFAATNAYTVAVLGGVKSVAKKYNATVTFFDSGFDAATQSNQVQNATTSGKYNAYVIMPNDSAGIIPVVNQAAAKGIKIVASTFPIGKNFKDVLHRQVPGVTTTLGYSPVTDGQLTANSTIAACGNKNPCRVALMMGIRTTPFDAIRYNTFKATLKPHANIKIVAVADGGFDRAKGYTAMQNMLSATNKDIDVLANPSADQMTSGAVKAINDAGIKTGTQNPNGKFKIVSLAATKDGCAGVRNGTWTSTVVYLPVTMGKLSVKYLSAAVNGKPVPAAVNLVKLSPVGPVATKATLKAHPSWNCEWQG
jgi:ribose transport system substrate-binding protein